MVRSLERGLSCMVVMLIVLCTMAAAQQNPEIHSTSPGGPWSAASTWIRIWPTSGGNALPYDGDVVVITQGSSVTLDTNDDIQDIAHLDVRGVLTVQDGTNYKLGVSRIDLGRDGTGPAGAAFHVGSPTDPFASSFVVTLKSTHLSSTYTDPYENKTFAVHGGATLELHGKTLNAQGEHGVYVPIPSWYRLGNGHSFQANQSSMVLETSALGWAYRDQIVVASTDFDQLQAESFTIASVAGSTVTTMDPATKNHHGVIESGLVDERAEVALLSRNIVIQGDPEDPETAEFMRGGHMMFMNGEGTMPVPTIHIEGVELRSMGWKGVLGRYPIHFHMLGDASGNYVRSSSIHECFNRALTIHGTNGVLVRDVVAFDSWGHLFYFESGTEVGNTLEHNLGLVTRVPTHPEGGKALGDVWSVTGVPYFVSSDKKPAVYWITNTDNSIRYNVAAGSAAHGIWYDLDPYSPAVLPVDFKGNVSHSNGINGFHQEICSG